MELVVVVELTIIMVVIIVYKVNVVKVEEKLWLLEKPTRKMIENNTATGGSGRKRKGTK